MNSDPNSDSKQCPELKLGRVHSAHAHGPGRACTTHRPRQHYAQAAHTASCHNAHSAVSWHALASCRGCAWPCHSAHWPCRRPCRSRTLSCRRPPDHDTKFVSQHRPLPRVVSHALLRNFAAFLRVLQPVSLPILRHKGRPQPRYKPLYRDSPLARPPTLALAASPCTQAGRVVGLCRRVASCIVAPCALCHDTIHCIVTILENGQQPIQSPA